MKQAIIGHLQALLAIPSPTGMCERAADYVAAELARAGIDGERMHDGAVRAVMKGDRAWDAMAFAVHLDTLGAQVKRLKENGRIELVPVGTWSSRFAEGARAVVHTDDGTIKGTILPLHASGHIFDSDVDSLPVSWQTVELRVDAHAADAADLAAIGIHVGDMVSVSARPEFADNGYIVSRHLDNKSAVATLLAAAAQIAAAGRALERDVHLLFTVSEEVGTGASGMVDPAVRDLIAIDIATVGAGQASAEHELTVALGDQSGPFHRGLSRQIMDACRAAAIPFRRDVFRFYKSDLLSARLSGANARMALLAFGVDASHGHERTHIDALTALHRAIVELSAPGLPR